jgi:hypothetical protein
MKTTFSIFLLLVLAIQCNGQAIRLIAPIRTPNVFLHKFYTNNNSHKQQVVNAYNITGNITGKKITIYLSAIGNNYILGQRGTFFLIYPDQLTVDEYW